ncbi:TauD/TfdA family dioxygenase [Roseiarcaceae bacterium H3SJ34-1]|uniref:TauD/TfdA dioxygenase family protein n=1 Tax=Terripilifer ovatus TaxID=3032367 RepID=UPI003AB946EA|nr:TauD/TfdA family dioxygenase [Roseiarcaceae bacterium H3SJ34-1]
MFTPNPSLRLVSDHAALPAGTRISQIRPALGATISGFRFDGKPLSEDFRAVLRDLLHNRGLVVFEPGTVTAENFTAFAGFLGEFFHYAGPHTPRAPENPDATTIDSTRDKHLRNHIWHADGGFRADAPAFTALFAHQLPEQGGDTMYSNATWVYENLDPLFAAYLETLTVIQSADATGHITDRYLDPAEAAQARQKMPPFEMPLVRTHPVTGRKWIAVNESYVAYIKGVSRVMSQNLLGILFDMIKSPEATVRFTWTQGALAIWDNRVVQHKGIKDYGGGRRILYRATMTA